MNASVLDEQGRSQPMVMGCYGIGITRIVAAAIEQNHDDNGIIWPAASAFDVAIVPLGMDKSDVVREATEQLYAACADAASPRFSATVGRPRTSSSRDGAFGHATTGDRGRTVAGRSS